MAAYSNYLIDLMQRQVIFLDVMRKRGNVIHVPDEVPVMAV